MFTDCLAQTFGEPSAGPGFLVYLYGWVMFQVRCTPEPVWGIKDPFLNFPLKIQNYRAELIYSESWWTYVHLSRFKCTKHFKNPLRPSGNECGQIPLLPERPSSFLSGPLSHINIPAPQLLELKSSCICGHAIPTTCFTVITSQ